MKRIARIWIQKRHRIFGDFECCAGKIGQDIIACRSKIFVSVLESAKIQASKGF